MDTGDSLTSDQGARTHNYPHFSLPAFSLLRFFFCIFKDEEVFGSCSD